MPNKVLKPSQKTAYDLRNREITQILDVLKSNCLRQGTTSSGVDASALLAFRNTLDKLGQGFAVFGRYLACRADLFPISNCLAFGSITDVARPTLFENLGVFFHAQIGRPLLEVYEAFEPEPFQVCTLYQLHCARMHRGVDVVVKIQHPDVQDRLNEVWRHLSNLECVWVALGFAQETFADVVAHFKSTLTIQMDFLSERENLLVLKDDLQTSEWCRVPTAYPMLCGSKVLTIEGFGGCLNQTQQSDAGEKRLILAHSLCAGWLQQVFHGRVFTTAADLDHIVSLPNETVVFLSGPFFKLSSNTRENIGAYLTASAQHDPEQACRSLLLEMEATPSACDEKTLRHLFRQVVPFRDGGWGNIGVQDSLPEHIFVHWRLVTEHGYRPRTELLNFLCGLFQVSASAHQLAPDADPFNDALIAYQERLRNDQFQTAFATEQWSDALDKYAGSFSELPQKIDSLLTQAADGDLTLRFHIQEATEHRHMRNTSSVAISLLLLLVAVVLLVYHLTQSGITIVWLEKMGAVVFIMIGSVLLWIIMRSKNSKK
ncbi:MAG: ubiquinone biosynthesis protein [Candidatus Latescibacterota bacterium]|jgi:ubiquinone biosynthesis protein